MQINPIESASQSSQEKDNFLSKLLKPIVKYVAHILNPPEYPDEIQDQIEATEASLILRRGQEEDNIISNALAPAEDLYGVDSLKSKDIPLKPLLDFK